MPRVALIAFLGLAIGLGAANAAVNPHLDPSIVLRTCSTCHRGHGVSRSPMLPSSQQEVCLSCHGSAADVSREVAAGHLAPDASPAQIGPVLSQPFHHPLTPGAFSQYQPDVVTCTSCHSPHRSMADPSTGTGPPGRQKLSPKDPNRFEYELCISCHGSGAAATQSLVDISRLLDPSNRSYHPVVAPASEASPSVDPALTGKEVNCTDCHGNSDPGGARGPHGSANPFILRAGYLTVGGSPETAATYALCYSCHDRTRVLDQSPFPEHAMHIIEERASCATCHNPHGSVNNRALIRFGEETTLAGVAPSASTGRLEFLSSAPGSGACYLTCHGFDHRPETYGDFAALLPAQVKALIPPGLPLPVPERVLPPEFRRPKPQLRPQPPPD